MFMALQALNFYTPPSSSSPTYTAPPELLLLLATQNADKKEAPAAYEHRIAMMSLLLDNIRGIYTVSDANEGGGGSRGDGFVGNIAITKYARFIDKSAAMSPESPELSSSPLEPKDGKEEEEEVTEPSYPKSSVRQIWLLGYDTLIRLLNPKYYPPEHTLDPVYQTLLSEDNRILVFLRPSEEFGSEEEQAEFARNVDERVKGRLDLIRADGRMEGISSTKVRKGAHEYGDEWKEMVVDDVRGYILGEGLY